MMIAHSNRDICAVDDCEEDVKCSGFCSKHYSRFRKHGDPTIVMKGGRKSFSFYHRNSTESSEKHSYQDYCCLADIFPFLYDEEYMAQFKTE